MALEFPEQMSNDELAACSVGEVFEAAVEHYRALQEVQLVRAAGLPSMVSHLIEEKTDD